MFEHLVKGVRVSNLNDYNGRVCVEYCDVLGTSKLTYISCEQYGAIETWLKQPKAPPTPEERVDAFYARWGHLPIENFKRHMADMIRAAEAAAKGGG